MNKFFIKVLRLFFCLMLANNAFLFSQLQDANSFSGMAGSAMRMGFGARGMSMGNAVSAISNESVTSYYNPAVVPFQDQPTFNASYGILSLDRHLNFFSYTTRLKPNAGLSLSIINSGVSNIDGRDNDGLHTDTYSTSENAFLFTFGIKPSQDFSFGLTTKLFYYILYQNIKSTTLAFDLGALYRISDDISLAFVIQDLNGRYKWDTSNLYGEFGKSYYDKFPLRKRIAVAWSPSLLSSVVAMEIEYVGSEPLMRFGTELKPVEAVTLRFGVDQIMFKGEMSATPSAGISFSTNVMGLRQEIQYAYIFEPYSPSGIHLLSLCVSIQ